MEMENDAIMTFLSNFSMQWELMIYEEPVVIPWNLYGCPSYWNCVSKSLNSMDMGPRVHNYLSPRKIAQPPM
jgi:hypothetical protein